MAKKAKKSDAPTQVDAIKHKDARVNIPTQELRGFVAEDEAAPPNMLYPRDPSLDPQLVWKGKDQQDAAALEVPVVPIYIQEKIHPQALVENLRNTAKAGEAEPELTLFRDFNGLEDDFDKKVTSTATMRAATGADEPYDKLKRALRADIDESAWSSLYSTTSRPFAPPDTGKIAVKVINHYGDEVLKVFEM